MKCSHCVDESATRIRQRYANMTPKAALKALLATVMPRSTYIAANAWMAARDIASGRRCAPEIALLPRFVHTGDTVVDVGANHGMYAYHLSQLVGPTGRVNAFEPLSTNLQILRHTIKSLGLDNVTVRPQGCGENNEWVEFYVPVEGGVPQFAQARPGISGEHFNCEIVRMEDVIKTQVTFIKIDVEGAELFVLRGAERILHESRPTILFEASGATREFGYEQDAVFDFLREHGYKFFSGGFKGKPLEPREQFTEAEDYFAIFEMSRGPRE